MNDSWVWVPGYENRYRISFSGEIVSYMAYGHADSFRSVSQWIEKRGYKMVTLFRGNDKKHFKVHRLVLSAFDRIPSPFEEVNHINGVKTDNRIDNLEWVTGKENMRHAVDTGLTSNKNQGRSFDWVHDSGERFVGTAMELSRKHPELKWKSLYEVSGGRKRSNRGWKIMEAEK